MCSFADLMTDFIDTSGQYRIATDLNDNRRTRRDIGRHHATRHPQRDMPRIGRCEQIGVDLIARPVAMRLACNQQFDGFSGRRHECDLRPGQTDYAHHSGDTVQAHVCDRHTINGPIA